MAASNYYSPEPDAAINTGIDPVVDAPMIVGNPALSRRTQKKSNKNALMIGIPVAAVLIVGLGAAVMMSDKGSSPGDATTTQTSQTTTTTAATPPVTQSAQPTPAPIHRATVRHVASRSTSERAAAPSAGDNTADVNATVPVNPPAAMATPTPPPVISAPPPATTAPQAGQPVNPAPDTTTTQP